MRLGGNREEFASLWISLNLYSEMSFATKFMGVRVSVIEVNYNVYPPQKKTLFPLLSTLLTENEWGFFPHQPIPQLSRHQLGVLQFNSDTNNQELKPTPEVMSHKTVPHFGCQFQVPSCHLYFSRLYFCVACPFPQV